MEAARRKLAAEIHAAASEHDAAQADRLEAIMAAEPAPIGAGLQLAVKR